jgi:hypothetical protein
MALAPVVAARQAAPSRPSWFALFLKAYTLVTQRHERLRQSYLSFPWPRLHQHACSVASVAISRHVGDEETVLFLQIRRPERFSLAELDARIRQARSGSLDEFGTYRRQLRLIRLPLLLRRLGWWAALQVSGRWRAQCLGTFGVTGVGALGCELTGVLSPLTTTIHYGSIAADGSVVVQMMFDHRVLDGAPAARALVDLEQTLCGPIADELREFRAHAA